MTKRQEPRFSLGDLMCNGCGKDSFSDVFACLINFRPHAEWNDCVPLRYVRWTTVNETA